MSKPMLGLVLGGILGVFDGLSALISAPNDPAVKAGIVGIVIGSTVKGLLTGVLIGIFEQRVKSLRLGIVFGLAVGLFLAFLIASMNGYYWQIMLPGGILGVIVGYATFTFRRETALPVRSAQGR